MQVAPKQPPQQEASIPLQSGQFFATAAAACTTTVRICTKNTGVSPIASATYSVEVSCSRSNGNIRSICRINQRLTTSIDFVRPYTHSRLHIDSKMNINSKLHINIKLKHRAFHCEPNSASARRERAARTGYIPRSSENVRSNKHTRKIFQFFHTIDNNNNRPSSPERM